MNLIHKLKEKNNLPSILFLIVLINFLPVFLGNAFTKKSVSVSMIWMMLCFSIEIILLLFFYSYHKKEIKNIKKHMILLLISSFIMFVVQIKKFIQNEFYFMDIFNIGCMFVNIVLLYIIFYEFEIDERKIANFFKGIVWIGIVAVVWNMFLYHNEILASVGIVNIDVELYMERIKSFFANRNNLAFFLYVAIVSDVILINFEKDKKRYKIALLLFWFGVWCTRSKTGYLLVVILLENLILFSDTYPIKKKIILGIGIAILGILGFLNIMGYIPVNNIAETVSTERVKNLSGRKAIWNAGFELLNESPFNYIFGVGRFRSIEVLKFEKRSYTQFHNIYLDILLTGGIVELTYIGFLYFCVIEKILKSDLKKMFKKIYIMMYITYAAYIMLESLGRFSIGASDTLCLIFFLTIPLLHANSIKQTEKIEEKTKTEKEREKVNQ